MLPESIMDIDDHPGEDGTLSPKVTLGHLPKD
jgi:hypothetical protein